MRTTVDRAFSAVLRIDVVISNAGHGLFGAAEELSVRQIQHIIDTNLTGSIQVIRAALPHLRAQGSARILQISNYGSQAAFPGSSMYHATKWGIEGFTESVAQEVSPFGVGVTIVEPGGAGTAFLGRSAKIAEPIAAYNGTPAHAFQDLLGMEMVADTSKMVAAMIDSVNVEPAPLRLLLGSDSYSITQQALRRRLEAAEAARAVAESTDADANSAAPRSPSVRVSSPTHGWR